MKFLFSASKEKELDTNTMLLKSIRFTFLAALSVHIVGGMWFFLSCRNTVDVRTSTATPLHEDDHHQACKPDTWGNHEGIIKIICFPTL